MVRLEKILYEQVLNNQTLKRSRIIGSPTKWYTENRQHTYTIAAFKMFNQGITGFIFRKIEPIMSYFLYQWRRDIALQRGLALEDFDLFKDRELRRDPFFEHIARQSLHPYQWVMFKQRRARYYKVERSVRGFFVPDYIRREAEDRLLSDTAMNITEWQEFLYKNWISDLTPSTRYTVIPRWHPLEFFNIYGWFQVEAWDRYFMNEIDYDQYQDRHYDLLKKPFPRQDLDSEKGRAEFIKEVNRFIEIYPGAIVREGEKFDFEEFFAKVAITENKDLSKFDKNLIEKAKKELQEQSQNLLAYKEDKSGAKKILGTILPEFLREKMGKTLQK